ncbi:hypothetical protein NVIRENTERO_00531 [Sodalis praecaptivus]|nr:hypothetical protein NVIRENTERO_00531 [Sodalis praecaptivus]
MPAARRPVLMPVLLCRAANFRPLDYRRSTCILMERGRRAQTLGPAGQRPRRREDLSPRRVGLMISHGELI